MSDLPAHNLADVRLADLVESPGCPVCTARARAIERHLEAWLWENVNDIGVRRELDASRGLCSVHVGELIASDRDHSGSMLGSAILLDAMLRARRTEVEAAHRARGRRARGHALQAASRAPDCLVCRVGSEAEASVVDGILRHLDGAAWTEATSRAAFCLRHLVDLMRAAGGTPAWRPVERQQLERVEGLHRTIGRFIAHSSYDTRHLRTAEEVASIEAVGRLLGAGAEHAGSRPPKPPGWEPHEGASLDPGSATPPGDERDP